ncbi:MAG TPA: STAS domain-containing protein [Chitinispirillaceae bacterium]|nr:STAS domain-containing protein [Chitinispirillaceae bacterium]
MLKGTLEFSLTEDSCTIRLIGAITWEVSADLDTFLSCVLTEIAIKQVYFDLSQTTYMDSTSLGVLAHFKRHTFQYHVIFSLLNPSEDIFKNLHDVGLTRIFEIIRNSEEQLPPGSPVPSSKKYSPKEISALVRKTHLALAGIDEKNRELFDHIIKSIDGDEAVGKNE